MLAGSMKGLLAVMQHDTVAVTGPANQRRRLQLWYLTQCLTCREFLLLWQSAGLPILSSLSWCSIAENSMPLMSSTAHLSNPSATVVEVRLQLILLLFSLLLIGCHGWLTIPDAAMFKLSLGRLLQPSHCWRSFAEHSKPLISSAAQLRNPGVFLLKPRLQLIPLLLLFSLFLVSSRIWLAVPDAAVLKLSLGLLLLPSILTSGRRAAGRELSG